VVHLVGHKEFDKLPHLAQQQLVALPLPPLVEVNDILYLYLSRQLLDFVGHCYVDHIIHLKMTDLTGSG
jgi:N6-adenosine-specific RNA methylase IME4